MVPIIGNLSWTIVVVHSRDDKRVGVAHEITSPKNQPKFFETILETKFFTDWLDWLTWLTGWLADCLTNWLTDQLTDSTVKRNLITAKTMGWFFSLFDVTSARKVPFGILWYVQAFFFDLSVSSFVFHLSLPTAKVSIWWWLPLRNRDHLYFS